MSLVYFVLVVTVLASVAASPFETSMNGMRQSSTVKDKFGAEELQDPDDPEYKKLAKEAYDRYHTFMDSLIFKNIIVAKVTRQVVQGFIYRVRYIVFAVNPVGYPHQLVCNSKVWEKVNNQKEFNTNCVNIEYKQQNRVTRRKLDGEEEKDPNDPEYQELAKESLAKYIRVHNDHEIIPKEIIVTRATYQVVSGFLKRIQFVVLTNLPYSLACDSKVWEQPWLNEKDIDVDCIPNYDQ